MKIYLIVHQYLNDSFKEKNSKINSQSILIISISLKFSKKYQMCFNCINKYESVLLG